MRRPERARSETVRSNSARSETTESGKSTSGADAQVAPPPSYGRRRTTAPPLTGKRNAADSQKRILDAAEQEFARSGFAGARLREIADAAQVQPALIHHYFTDKRGLYEAVIRRALDQMTIASFRVLGEGRDLRGYLRGFVDLLVDFYETNQNLLAIMRAEAHAESGIFLSVVREKTKPILDAVLVMTQTLMASGEVRSDLSAREVLVGGLSLILYPIVDAPLLAAVLPESVGEHGSTSKSPERRKAAITELLLGAIQPRAPEQATPPLQKSTAPVSKKPARSAVETKRAKTR